MLSSFRGNKKSALQVHAQGTLLQGGAVIPKGASFSTRNMFIVLGLIIAWEVFLKEELREWCRWKKRWWNKTKWENILKISRGSIHLRLFLKIFLLKQFLSYKVEQDLIIVIYFLFFFLKRKKYTKIFLDNQHFIRAKNRDYNIVCSCREMAQLRSKIALLPLLQKEHD